MIKRSIITALLLFAFYSFFTIWMAPVWWHASQDQWQDNIITAQDFLYNDSDTLQNVIVGSSLSCRLAMDSLPGIYNLSFNGESVFDGLNILNHKTPPPKNVFIEMNVVLRKENHNFTSTINSPILFYPRKILPSLRFNKQPIGILAEQMNYRIINPLINIFKPNILKNHENKITNTQALFPKMLQLQIDSYSQAPDPKVVTECFNTLKKYTNELESKGINIVFFEMPVNFQLNNLPKANGIRNAFYKYYPINKYKYIPTPDLIKFETTDGVHLGQREALQYTIYLKSKLNALNL